MISTLSLSLMVFLIAIICITLFVVLVRQRLVRINTHENRIANQVNALDTARLQSHLQGINISVVEIDAEVAALKEDILIAAQKHHLTVDEDDTHPDRAYATKNEKRIRVLEKEEKRTARVS